MTVDSQEITTVVNIVNHSMFSISKMLRTAVSYEQVYHNMMNK